MFPIDIKYKYDILLHSICLLNLSFLLSEIALYKLEKLLGILQTFGIPIIASTSPEVIVTLLELTFSSLTFGDGLFMIYFYVIGRGATFKASIFELISSQWSVEVRYAK